MRKLGETLGSLMFLVGILFILGGCYSFVDGSSQFPIHLPIGLVLWIFGMMLRYPKRWGLISGKKTNLRNDRNKIDGRLDDYKMPYQPDQQECQICGIRLTLSEKKDSLCEPCKSRTKS